MLKKILSLIMIAALVSSTAVKAFAVDDNQVVTLDIEGQSVTYCITDNAHQRIVKTTSKCGDYVIIYDKDTSSLSINGHNINFEEPSIMPFAWVEYERVDGTLGIDVRDASVIAGAIIALAGGPVGWASAIAIAGVIIGRGLDNVYYTKISYYDDELIGSRPKTKVEWHFYADADRTDEL